MSDLKHQEDELLLERDDILLDDDDRMLSEESEADGLVVEDEAEELLLTEPDDEGEGSLGVIVGEISPSDTDEPFGGEGALSELTDDEISGEGVSPDLTGGEISGEGASEGLSRHDDFGDGIFGDGDAADRSDAAGTENESDRAGADVSADHAESGKADRNGSDRDPGTKIVVGVRFRSVGKSYYFAVGDLPVKRGSHVIVETARGLDYGTSICDPMELDRRQFKAPLKRIVRLATAADEKRVRENREKEHEAYRICYEKIRRRELDMKLIQAEYAFDGSKILFYFTADERVDFRDLVKDLAGVFHTRIELRQIGVRDETRILGGCGICGRPLCCHTYLTDFAPVSIKMAKEQNLSLNPAKISGTCGRLMCCLKNEEEVYEELNKNLPKPGDEVEGSDGLTGEVAGVDILRQLVRILVEVDDEKELHEYPADEITILRRRKRGQAKPKINRSELRDPKSARRSAAAGAAGRTNAAEQGNAASGNGEEERRDGADGRSAGRRSPAEHAASETAVNAADTAEQTPPQRSERSGRRTRQDGRGDRTTARTVRTDRTSRGGQEGSRTDRTSRGGLEGSRTDRASRGGQEGSRTDRASRSGLEGSRTDRASRSGQEENRAERSGDRPEEETVSKQWESAEHTDRRNVRAEDTADHVESDAIQSGEAGNVSANNRRRSRSRSNAARMDRSSQTRGDNVRAGNSRRDGLQGQEISSTGAESSEEVMPQAAAGADSSEQITSREAAAERRENAASRTHRRRNRRRSGSGNGTGTSGGTESVVSAQSRSTGTEQNQKITSTAGE